MIFDMYFSFLSYACVEQIAHALSPARLDV